jgi:F0F1-type ATP synthase assembly protein I
MADKKRTSGLEIVGGLLIVQGLISTVAQLVTGHDVGVLGLIDKFVVHTDWWAGLICALIGFALAVLGERKARPKEN